MCNISGFIQPVVNKVVDACSGGFITLDYSTVDACGNFLSAPQVFINVEPAPEPTLEQPLLPMAINCWEAAFYNPGTLQFTNNLTGNCERSGFIYPIITPLWESCEGGNILVRWEGTDECGFKLETKWFVVMVLPDDKAPVGECTSIEESLLFINETPNPDELDDFKDEIASNFSDDCSDIVVTVVGDTGDPICGLDGQFERIYQMEVADECGNVADTCTPVSYTHLTLPTNREV